MNKSFNQLIQQASNRNQWTNQPIIQQINISRNQSIIHSINQSINQSISQSINYSFIHSFIHSINQSINQLFNQSDANCFFCLCPSLVIVHCNKCTRAAQDVALDTDVDISVSTAEVEASYSTAVNSRYETIGFVKVVFVSKRLNDPMLMFNISRAILLPACGILYQIHRLWLKTAALCWFRAQGPQWE